MIPHSKPLITDTDREAVQQILATGMVAQGQVASRFADALANYTRMPKGVVTSSGSAAITLVLRALQLPVGGEVVIPTYVCRSVGDAVVEAGLTPILCDVGDSWSMTPQNVDAVISGRTVAVIVPHIFGIVADVDAFARFGVPIIEDACQSFGTHHSKFIGTRGTASVYSFNATKCLTTGEGGYATSQKPELAERICELANGSPSGFTRFFSPMTDMQAALGISQLSRYDNFIARRLFLVDRYFDALADIDFVVLPSHVRHNSTFFRFPVLTRGTSFDQTRSEFETRGVAVRRGVDALLHHIAVQPSDNFPEAERLFRETVSLPLYPAMTNDEQDVVIEACRSVWRTS